MSFKVVVSAFALAAALGFLAVPAEAAPKKKTVIVNHGHTVFVSRDEDGRTRTRIIIQKRSYLDPGTEVFPGENSDHRYAFEPGHHASGVLDNTAFGGNQSALPGAFTLPGRSNPFIQF